ncbi:MAG: hypothetical protein JZU70_06315 [Chlorobium sp.]|jgi:ABC-type sulfate/molybdate transport systems ATPase subunit|nr:hypothetical protein [Chlorobium sp.]
MAINPKVLLPDEPFSALDAEIPRELYINLEFAKGDKVFVSLNRVRVFTGDDVI